jgi:RNA polymerase sigma-70 factor (ECF subfamily)
MDARGDIDDTIAAARRGAPDAVGRLFEAARGHLLQFAARELPGELRAKVGPSDVVQETAVDVQRDFHQFAGSTPEELFAWLRGILRNNVLDAVRQYRDSQKRNVAREESLSLRPALARSEAVLGLLRTPDESAIRREEEAILHHVLARLTPAERQVLELRYWKGLSFVAIASHVGRSPDMVRRLWYRALEALRSEIREEQATALAVVVPARVPE